MRYLCPHCDSAQTMIGELAERLNRRVVECAKLENDVRSLAEQVRTLLIEKQELQRQLREREMA